MESHPFSVEMPYASPEGTLTIGVSREWRQFIRAYEAHQHRAWIAWADHRDAVESAPDRPVAPPVVTYGSLQAMVAAKFAPLGPGNVSIAFCVVDRETGGTWNPNAQNPNSSAGGLWQYVIGTWQGYESIFGLDGSRFDPYLATSMTVLVVSHYGWGDWHAFDGSCGI